MGRGIRFCLFFLAISTVIQTGLSEPFDFGNLFGLGDSSATDTGTADATTSDDVNTSSSQSKGFASSFDVDKDVHIPIGDNSLDANLDLAASKSVKLSKNKKHGKDGIIILPTPPSTTTTSSPYIAPYNEPQRVEYQPLYPHPPPPPYEARPYPRPPPPPGPYEYEHENRYDDRHNVHDIGSRPTYG